MTRRSLSLIAVVSLTIVFLVNPAAAAGALFATPPPEQSLRIVDSAPDGITLSLTTLPTPLVESYSDQGKCYKLAIPGWGESGQAGEPSLPVKGTLVGIPASAEPRLTIVEKGPVTVREGVNLCPVATFADTPNPTEAWNAPSELLWVSPAAYAKNRDYPGELAQINATAMIRSQRVAQVLFSPYQYNPVTRQLKTYAWLRVRVEFEVHAPIRANAQRVDEGAFENILRGQVINYEQARSWRSQPAVHMSAVPRPQASQPAYKIAVEQDGMVKLTFAALQAAGLPVDTLDPRTLRLSEQGSEVAIFVEGEEDGVLNAADYVLFYGQKVNTRFTNTNIYWLTWGNGNGLRMGSTDGAPGTASTPESFQSTIHLEESNSYQSANSAGPGHDHWYWNLIYPPTVPSKTYTFSITRLDTSAPTANFSGLFKGYAADPQQRVLVSINGNLVVDDVWEARGVHTFDVVVPTAYLIEGTNTIKVECPLADGITLNYVLLDWLELRYSKKYAADGVQTRFRADRAGDWQYRLTGLPSSDTRAWDITAPKNPVRIVNAQIEGTSSPFTLVFQQSNLSPREYLAASPASITGPASITLAQAADLRATTNGADYLIISHPNFISAVQPLADFYTEKGLRVRVVNVQDIYDEFNDGVFDSQAIRDFLEYAYVHWAKPAPVYVLLVGDGNYDFKNYMKRNETVYIPPYLAEVDPWMGETAADNRYVTVSGSDVLPDMALGRLPVQTVADANSVVAKILSYYQHATEDWADQVLFAAASHDPPSGNFAAQSDAVIDTYLTPKSIPTDKVYYGATHTSGPAARQAMTERINAGRGLVHFAGHSNPYAWFGIVNNNATFMMDRTTAQALANTDKYPIVVSMTCLTGYYILPGIVTLDETLIRGSAKGAVATWSPTGQGIASGHDLLDNGLFQALYYDQITALGLATNAAKYDLYANSTGLHHELIDTYVLFGDPAMLYQNTPTTTLVENFRAARDASGVVLSWQTLSEGSTAGFHLYRRERSGSFAKLNGELIPPQHPGQPLGAAYTYLDSTTVPGTAYEYRLDVVENSMQVSASLLAAYWPYWIGLPFVQR